MKKRNLLITAITVVSMLAATIMPVYATEADLYPLKGTFPYTQMTREIIDNRLNAGWAVGSNPYAEVGMVIPFTNNAEWAQANSFRSSVASDINAGKILITLAGLSPTPDSYSGSELTAEEETVKQEVIKYLNSYNWKQASDYEKAAYTAEYIASRCTYLKDDSGDGANRNNIYSCLVNGVSMCDGFTQTYHLLTRAVGLKSVQVSNVVHAWNYVSLDNQWYKIDMTLIGSSADYQSRTRECLLEPAKDAATYVWAVSGMELDFDPTLPKEPMY